MSLQPVSLSLRWPGSTLRNGSPGCKHVPGLPHHAVQGSEQGLAVADQRGAPLTLVQGDWGLPQVESVI